ncbi:MAG: dihydrofolate reductase family protein [Candidatus Limnocylindrales bacterium]
MPGLSYASLTSLDGYFVDADGRFDFAEPDAEVHAFANDLERSFGTHLYGRRLYEVMAWWESIDPSGDDPPEIRDFAAIWQAADKVVFSRSLAAVASARTRIERTFDADAIRRLVTTADRPVTIGGAELAAVALRAGLVDELHQFVNPVIVGGGRRWLPDGLELPLRLMDERRFGNGVVYMHYAVERNATG